MKVDNLPRYTKQSTSNRFSLWTYNSKDVKDLIRFMKTHRSYFLSRSIGEQAFLCILDYIADQQSLSYFRKPIVIPIPIGKNRLSERGFNQNTLWGKKLAQKLNGTFNAHILKKSRTTKKQALISNRSERFRNVKNSFTIPKRQKRNIDQKDIILIDDLVTTGATLDEAKRVLKKAGARNIITLTLAH